MNDPFLFLPILFFLSVLALMGLSMAVFSGLHALRERRSRRRRE